MAVSDKTLLTVGLITFLVTLGCFSIIMYNVGGVPSITGLAVTNQSYGYINVSVKGTVAVTMVNSNVSFGNGTLRPAGTTNLFSNGTLQGSGFVVSGGEFRLRNDGNVFVNITMNGTPASTLFGANSEYGYFAFDTNSTLNFGMVCSNTTTQNAGDKYTVKNETQISATREVICPNMSYTDKTDEFNVTLHLNLSDADDLVGFYNDTLEFYITSLGHS